MKLGLEGPPSPAPKPAAQESGGFGGSFSDFRFRFFSGARGQDPAQLRRSEGAARGLPAQQEYFKLLLFALFALFRGSVAT